MSVSDRRGVATSASSQDEVDAYDDGFELFLNYEMSAGGAMKQVLADHPESVLAVILRGYMMMMLESTAVHPKVSALAATTAESADHASDRERLHLEALGRWAGGDVFAAAHSWDRLLAEDPRDLLALKMHHYTTFWTGRAGVLLSAVEGVLDAWDENVPGYDHVLGMHAFALNETGRYERAETVGREAVDRNAEDLWSVHAVAHALEMQGDHRRGDEFFSVDPAAWGTKNPFVGHVWWHAALFPWDAGDYGRVLDIYDHRLRPASTEFFLDIQNLSSLLTRLELAGVDVGDRWEELGDHATARTGDHVLSFTDVHCALTLARTGRVDDLTAFVTSLEAHRSALPDGIGSAGAERAIEVTRALAAAADGDPGLGASILGGVRGDLAPIGGSHAQRDLFDLVLADMVMSAGDHSLAVNLLRARSARWPRSVPTLSRYGDALEQAGQVAKAGEIRERAAALMLD